MPVTAEARPQTQPQVSSQRPEAPTSDYAVLLLGAGSGLGESLARRLAQKHQVIAGMRSPEHFDTLKRNIAEDGGIEPLPLLADITDRDQFRTAFKGLALPPSLKLHYLPVAAGGLEYPPLGKEFLTQVVKLRRMTRNGGKVTHEAAQQATNAIREQASKPEAMAFAMGINRDAPIAIFQLLREEGHVDKGTTILTTSSSISDEADPSDPDSFRGPQFYRTIGISKKAGVLAVRSLAAQYDMAHLDAVAPELPDTAVGEKIETLVEILKQLDPPVEVNVPKVPRGIVAVEILKTIPIDPATNDRRRTLYIDESGVGPIRPQSWDKPFVPYL